MALKTLVDDNPVRTWPVRGVGLLLVLATVLAFAPALQAGFVQLDDLDYVRNNRQIQEGLTLATLRYAFSGFRISNWHPLTMLSHALDCSMYGLNPVGHHLTSLLLHALNALLLFRFLLLTTGKPARASLVAALFALHPLRVESVAWVSERKDVLSALFFLLTLLAWTRYAAAPRLGRWLLAAGLLSLGLMAKAMLVTAPFVLLLLEFWPLRRPTGPLSLLDKLPLLALCAIVSVLTVLAQGTAVVRLAVVSLPVRVGNAAESYFRYLWKTIWPVDLSVFYPLPQHPNIVLAVAACLALVAVMATAFALRRRFPVVFVGLCWFIGMLVPTIGLVQVGSQSMADRYSYLPQIGLLIAFVYSLPAPRPALVAPAATAAAVVLASLIGLTLRQCRVWRSDETLFRQADRQAPGEGYFVQGALAYVAIEQGRFAEGEARYRKALRINPVDSMSLANLGALMLRQGKDSQALDLLQRADNTQPGKPLVQDRLAVALVRLGKVDEGLVLFRRLVSEPHPAEFEAHYALALEIKGQTSEALSILRRAVAAEPGNAELHFNLGTMLAQHNQFAQAVPHLREALRLDPSIPGVAQSLSNALEDAQRHP